MEILLLHANLVHSSLINPSIAGSGTVWQPAQQRERTEGGQGEGAAEGPSEKGGH